jgi:hypothetical protein
VADTESAALLFLTAPMVQTLPVPWTERCELVIDEVGAVSVELDEGRVVSWQVSDGDGGDTQVWGSVSTWLDALLDGRVASLEMAGNLRLATTLLSGFHDAWS